MLFSNGTLMDGLGSWALTSAQVLFSAPTLPFSSSLLAEAAASIFRSLSYALPKMTVKELFF